MSTPAIDTRRLKDQRWLTAHNAWNTTPPLNNQCFTITELLNYGVRGFALDIWGDDEHSFHLQHGGANPLTATVWKKVLDELDAWLTAHPREIVVLFFESYLAGPDDGHTTTSPLHDLDTSLSRITCYKSGKGVQQAAMLNCNFSFLIDGMDETGNIIDTPQRLFAFIEKVPDEGPQDLFPVMTEFFSENVYGDESLKPETWAKLRKDSSYDKNRPTFLNHFGNAPTGDEWDRNKTDKIVKHTQDFLFNFGGRYPNFISLDFINWNQTNAGPMEAIRQLQSKADLNVTAFKWDKVSTFDDVVVELPGKKISGFKVETARGQGITKIIPVLTETTDYITSIQLVNVPGHGIVNMRYMTQTGRYTEWLTEFEKITNTNDPNLATHSISGTLAGFCCRTSDGYGVVDFAAAMMRPGD